MFRKYSTRPRASARAKAPLLGLLSIAKQSTVSSRQTTNNKPCLPAGRRRTTNFLRVSLVLIFLFLATLSSLSIFDQAPRAGAAASLGNINFQMRLLTSTGTVVPDGNYNVEFKVFDQANSTGSSQGSCSGDARCLWVETRTGGNVVRVVNGYMSVALGSVTAFGSTIKWDQPMWLGVRIGGTGAPSWEAIELTSDGTATGNKIALTAVPYAFRASVLASSTAGNTGTLSFGSITNNPVLTLPNETGTVCTNAAAGTCSALSFYIQNQNSGQQASSNFWISNTGRADTSFISPLFDSISGGLNIGTSTATGVTIGSTANTTAISLQGAVAATYDIGTATGTGTITLGKATTAATQTINISSANSTGSTQTINIGAGTSTTSGGKVVNLASGVPGASTTNTIHIGDGGTTTGTVAVTLGSVGAAAHHTLIQGGNDATALGLQAATSGTISIGTTNVNIITAGSTANTGTLTFGQSTAGETINIGNGNVASGNTNNINIGATATSTGKDVITVGSLVAASTLTLQGGNTSSAISIQSAASGTISIGTSGVANTVTIGNTSGANTQAINIGTNATASSTTNLIVGSTIAGTTTLQSAGGVKVSTLGAVTSNSQALCRDTSTNTLTSCDSGAGGKPFIQGGNSFGATAVLGTNDSNSLSFKTNNIIQATIAAGGATVFKNSNDTATAFQIQNASGNAVLNVDTGSSIVSVGAFNAANTSFPTTGILDNFNRSNTGPPPSASWSQGPLDFTAGEGLQLSSNAVIRKATGSFRQDDYWNPTTFGPDSEVYTTVSTVGGSDQVALYLRGINIGAGTSNGYYLNISLSGNWDIQKLTSGTGTNLVSTFTQVVSSGDSVGFSARGTTLTAWYKTAAGSWTALASGIDATYASAGSIGVGIAGTGGTILDNFGGGTRASGFSVDGSGKVTSRNITDSTTAFQIQNASGQNLFVVDSTNSLVAIGGTAGFGQLTNNGSTLNSTLAVANDSDGGALGGTPGSPLTAAQSVDIYTSISVNQTTAGQTITLPTPTASTTYGRLLYISNIGTVNFTLGSATISTGTTATLIWSNTNGGASWQFGGADASSILNQNSSDQTGNFRISGTGRANTRFTAPSFDSISGGLLIGDLVATGVTIGNTSTTTATLLQGTAAATYTIGTSNNIGGIVLGNSTDTNTIDIGNSNTATGKTQTIRIGAGTPAGTGATAITIGNNVNGGAVTLIAGTGNINLNAATIATNQATLNLFNATATTVNLLQAATTISLGATTGTVTIRNANTTIGNAAGSGTLTNNGATLNSTLALGNLSAGSIGSAATTVDIYTSFSIAPTAAGRTYTIPTPTANTAYGRIIYISNIAAASNTFTIGTATINPGATASLIWSNSNGADSWQFAGADAGNLQGSYNNSTGGTTPEILLDSTRGALDIQNKFSGGVSGANLLNVRSSVSGDLATGSTILFGVSDTGAASFQNSANSATAFQIQNAASAQLFNIDTTNPITDITNNATNNLVTNGSLEANATGWAKMGSTQAAVAQDNSQRYIGNDSLKIVTNATDASGTNGAKYNLTTSTLVSNTTYNLTLYAKTTPGTSFATFEIGRAEDGSTNTSCLTAQTVSGSGWTQFSCTFTTATTSGTPYVYVRETDQIARTFYIDGVQLTRYSLISNQYADQTFAAGDWQAKSSATVTRDTTQNQAGAGTASVKIVTAANTASGVQHNITLNNSTLYYLNFYAKLDAASTALTTMEAGYSSDGSTDDTVCITGQTVVSTAWTNYVCTITTPSSHSGTPYFYVKGNVASARTFYVDNVLLSIGGPLSAYREGQMAVNGIITSPLTLQNQSDSTSAFQVQNSNGVSLLTVNTINGIIQIGSSTSNSATTIFALNNNDGTTTPTEVDGGMYYNNSTSQFLCGENGFWVNCGVPPRDHSYDLYDEFMNGNSGSLATGAYGIGGLNWYNSLIPTPGVLTYNNNPTGGNTPAASADRPGIMDIQQTGIANNSGQTMSLGLASVLLGTSRIDLKTAVNITGANLTVLVGLHNETTATTAPTTGVYWKEAGNGTWQYCYVNGTPAETCANSAVTATAGVWARLEIVIVSSSEVDYYINGTKIAVTGITYNTTNKVAPAYTSYKTTGVNNTLDVYIDYFELLGTTSAAR